MRRTRLGQLALLCCAFALNAQRNAIADEFPTVPDGFEVKLFAREPMIRNPASMAFDARGRLFVGQGPQFRSPKPDTPGDEIRILIDDDDDGVCDEVKTFARGLNCVQSMAWKGRDLYVANSPDLTILRDTDGDDVADVYIKLYTDLGNIEHGLHGLNFGPDGKLYMSKGNSKGLVVRSRGKAGGERFNQLRKSEPNRVAPKAFLDLWDVDGPEGVPDIPPPQIFTAKTYKATYHDPADDWGRTGGILRCDPDGSNLEIVSRGLRNPWDITFDAGFNFLGTDNDQVQGDKIFMPFMGADFGWGHSWSDDWLGENHPPTTPPSGPLFEGSGTGIICYLAQQFPEKYRGAFFINDWKSGITYAYHPVWDGALMRPKDNKLEVFAKAGRALYRPTDIEVGPDGALWVLGWGSGYGATFDDKGQQTNAGRIFRIRHKDKPVLAKKQWLQPKRLKAYKEWTVEELFEDLGHHVPAWRVDAQDEVLRRPDSVVEWLNPENELRGNGTAQVTWTVWTASRIAFEKAQRHMANIGDADVNPRHLLNEAWWEKTKDPDPKQMAQTARQQLSRAFSYSFHESQFRKFATVQEERKLNTHLVNSFLVGTPAPESDLGDPRGRFEVAVFLRSVIWLPDCNASTANRLRTALQADCASWIEKEDDPIVFSILWRTLRGLESEVELRKRLTAASPGLRKAGILALADLGKLTREDALALRFDSDPRVSDVASLWLRKVARIDATLLKADPPSDEFLDQLSVRLFSDIKDGVIRFTTDGSDPKPASTQFAKAIDIRNDTTLKAAVFRDGKRIGPVLVEKYNQLSEAELSTRAIVFGIKAKSGNAYRIDLKGLRKGGLVYTDRAYEFTDFPERFTSHHAPRGEAPSQGKQNPNAKSEGTLDSTGPHHAERDGDLARATTVLMTANADSGSTGDDFLTFSVPTDVNVWLGHDVRVAPPKWMRVGSVNGFVRTDHIVSTNDSKFRLHWKSFESGKVTLGGNTDNGEQGGRSNYIVLIQPKPPTRLANPTTIGDVVPLLAKADAERGRRLFFFSQATRCTNCHHVEGRGQKFAPDLKSIGKGPRRKPAEIVESILKPSAWIVEGFRTQTIVTTKGKTHSGFVLGETGDVVRFVDTNARRFDIKKSDIEERVSKNVSAMPGNVGEFLTPQQVADLVAYLLALTN